MAPATGKAMKTKFGNSLYGVITEDTGSPDTLPR